MTRLSQDARLSLVIPAYGEAHALSENLPALVDFIAPIGELIVVDDGSPDETAQVVKAAAENSDAVRLVRHEANLGKGAAVRTGMLSASGDVRVFCDADVAYGIEGIRQVVTALGGADVAIGSRSRGGHKILSAHPVRAMAGRVFAVVVKEVAIAGFKDTQCGLKGFTATAADELFARSQIDGFGFDVEILCLATAAGFRIEQVDVEEVDQLPGRRSSVRVIPAAVGMLKDVFAVRRILRNGAEVPAKR